MSNEKQEKIIVLDAAGNEVRTFTTELHGAAAKERGHKSLREMVDIFCKKYQDKGYHVAGTKGGKIDLTPADDKTGSDPETKTKTPTDKEKQEDGDDKQGDEPSQDGEGQDGDKVDMNELSFAELKAEAKVRGIDVKGIRSSKKMIAAIVAAEKQEDGDDK